MSPSGPNTPVTVTPGADIALVMTTELELEGQLTRAREEARILIEAAYTEAGARSSGQEQELSAAREHFQAEVEAERDRQAAKVLADGKRAAARFDEVSEGRVTELAELVVARLLSGADG